MWKSSDIKLLLSLLLIPGLLVGCGRETAEHPVSIELTENISNLDSQNLEKSFDDVQKTNDEFQTLLDDFMRDIVAAKDGFKKRELVNSYEVNQKLIELETKVREYREQIFQTINEENLEQNFNNINQKIQNIRQITEKLKDGLGKEAIGEVQIYLGFFNNREVSYFGLLGPTTVQEINELLKQNSEQLKAKIIALGQVIADLESINKELVALAKKNEAKIKNLNNVLQNELNQLKFSLLILWTLIFIIFLALAAILITLLVEKSQSRRRKKLTQERNNIVNSTDNFDIPELIFAVDDKVEDIYGKSEKMSNLWENKWKNLQNQINQLQQNQQVKTPDNLTEGYIEAPKTTNYSPGQVTPEPEMDEQISPNQHPGLPTLKLMSIYEENPSSLLKNAIEVSAADGSSGQEVILKRFAGETI
ncbi:MAG: hypothetical protein F6K17_12300, partial [Okeania sp. SIO3C4]|nr:hypothetical protein [Okeania sp. SIO3C4]